MFHMIFINICILLIYRSLGSRKNRFYNNQNKNSFSPLHFHKLLALCMELDIEILPDTDGKLKIH